MISDDVINLNLIVTIPNGTEEELDAMIRRLLMRLREFDIESADLISDSLFPSGTKAVDPVTVGAIALAVLPVTLPKILEFLQIWSLQAIGAALTALYKARS